MKNVMFVSIIAAFLFFVSDNSSAQGQEKWEETKEKVIQDKGQDKLKAAKENQENAQDKLKAAKEKQERAEGKKNEAQAQIDKDLGKNQDKFSKNNQGNAHGKNKGNMTGREFGQHRAAMAQNNAEHTRARLHETENLITYHRERFSTLKQSIEEERKMPNADKKALEEREIKIRRAEIRLSQLEESLNESREKLRRTERLLEEVID